MTLGVESNNENENGILSSPIRYSLNLSFLLIPWIQIWCSCSFFV